MANIKSAKKRIEIARNNMQRNRMYKSRIKMAIKRFESTLASGDVEGARKAYINAVSVIDKVAAKGVIHKNNAARRKAALAIKLNSSAKTSEA